MGSSCCASNAVGPKDREAAGEISGSCRWADPAGLPLLIGVSGAHGLRDPDWLPGAGRPDCYCEVRAGGRLLHTTSAVRDAVEPVWEEECRVPGFAAAAGLEFRVYGGDAAGKDLLGAAALAAEDFAERGFNGELPLVGAVEAGGAHVKVRIGVEGAEPPPGQASELTVTVDAPAAGRPWGLSACVRDGETLHVLDVSEGAFLDYNASAQPAERVIKTDFITRVNGAVGSSVSMVRELWKNGRVECRIKRGVHFAVVVDRGEASAPLGLELSDDLAGDQLVVKGADGRGHNARARDHERLLPCDRIVAVGSFRGPAQELHRRLVETSGRVRLQVLRPADGRQGEGGLARPAHWRFR